MRLVLTIFLLLNIAHAQTLLIHRGNHRFVNQEELPFSFNIRSSTGWLYGVNGVDGFTATQYAGLTNFSYNAILKPYEDVSLNLRPTCIFSIGFTSLSLQFFVGLGNYDGGLTNEYLLVGKNGSRRGVVSTTDSILAGTTFMITVTSSADSTTIYINGQPMAMTGSAIVSGTNGITGNIMSLSGRYQASTNTYSNPFYGQQKEVSIWNKKLSNAEVSALYDDYNNAGGLAGTTYDLSAHTDYGTNVRGYYKRLDTLSAADPYAYDEKGGGQKMLWTPNAFWDAKENGSYGYLPESSTIDSTEKLWTTTTDNVMTLNHFSRIAEWNNKIFVQWFTHNKDEHGPGQFLRYSISSDYGDTWTAADTLFPPMDDPSVRLSTREGRQIHTLGFVPVGDSLYAIGDVMDSSDLLSGYRGLICRTIDTDGNLSDYIHWLWIYDSTGSVTPVAGYPSYPFDSTNWSVIYNYLRTPGQRPVGSGSSSAILQSKISHVTGAYSVTGTLIEPAELEMPYGGYIRLWRRYIGAPSSVNEYFTQYSFDGDTWGVPMGVGAQIPYPVSLGSLVRLDNDRVALIGNPRNTDNISRDPLIVAIAGPEMIFHEVNIYDLRKGGPLNRYTGDAKNGRYSYPSVIKMSNGRIGVSYTTYGKEDIEFLSFEVPTYK